jgi:hypothetical protein
MNISLPFRLVMSLLIFSLAMPSLVTAQTGPDNRAIVAKATAKYYSLRVQGLSGFECKMTPDWDKFAAENIKPADPMMDVLAKKIKPVAMKVSMSMAGAPAASAFMTDGTEIDEGLTEFTTGLEHVTTDFIEQWWTMVSDTPFSAYDSDSVVKQEGAGYRFSQKQGASDSSILMDKDLVILEMDTLLQANQIIMRPKFIADPKGLLLTNLDSDIKSTDQHVSIAIEYQDVQGFKLPSKMHYKLTGPNIDVSMYATFSNYKLTKA